MVSDRADYGIDAPGVIRNFVVIAVIGLFFGLLIPRAQPRMRGLAPPLLSIGVSFAISAIGMIWSSKAGKFRLRDRLLDAIPWRGDEQVLDVGCGHGLMLIGAAKRLRGGKATGVDIWQSEDQAANSPVATRRNAQLEGVADRVEVRDGDARSLPLPGASFDVVLSSLALHNIYNAAEREKALSEILRVTKPGGWIGIIDIRHGAAYAKYLAAHGAEIVQTRTTFLFMLLTRAVVARRLP